MAKEPEVKATLELQEENVLEEIRYLSANSEVGDYNLIHAGIKQFEKVLKSKPKSEMSRTVKQVLKQR